MSRFFDALKEASRLRPRASADSGQAEWQASEAAAIDMPGVLEEPLVRRADPPAPEPAAAPPEMDLPEIGIPDPEPAAKNGSLGISVEITLDRKARLLPQAAHATVVEHYRRLRTKILQEQTSKAFRTLMVTSPGPQEGKTVTVLNLGLSFAMVPSFKILVLDGDLRRGSLGEWLGVGDRPGISNLIDGSAALNDVIFKCDQFPMHFMVRGTSRVSPAELLHSPELRRQMRRISEEFSLVLVDSPPVNLISDAQLLAGSCDAILLVARAFATTREALGKAAQDLLPFRVIGSVLNAGTRALPRHYHKYY